MTDLVERLRHRANDKRPMPKPFNLLLDAAEEIERLRREIADLAALLKDPAAIRINYLRGDIACQPLIDEARKAAFIEAAAIAELDADWSAFGKRDIEPWDTGPDAVRDYRLGIVAGRAIAAAIRAKAEETRP